MIGILLITHGSYGEALVQNACHVLNKRPVQLNQFGVSAQDDPLDLLPLARQMLQLVDNGEGALVLHPRDRRVQDRLEVIDRVRAGVLKTADFVDAPVPFTQAPEIYRRLRDEPPRALTYVFDWK